MENNLSNIPTVIIIGLGSDIGHELAVNYRFNGWRVVGTYRQLNDRLKQFEESIKCDLLDDNSIQHATRYIENLKIQWNVLIIASGTEEPIGSFFECDEVEWEKGFRVNALSPLRIIRKLYPLRHEKSHPSVVLFSGSGTNNAVPNYSVYCSSKLLLIKMCELLDSESCDTKFIIIGPGVVMTKIHQQTLRAGNRAAQNYMKVAGLYASPKLTTTHQEIFDCINWCHAQEKSVIGGRNISLVYDNWRNGGTTLSTMLLRDFNMYKMRRYGNEL